MTDATATIMAAWNTPAPAPSLNGHLPKIKRAKQLRWWGVLCGFVGNHMRTISPSAGCVWVAMFRFSTNGIATVGISQLAETCGMSPRAVRYALTELTVKNLIERITRGQKNCGVSRYRMLSTGAADQTEVPRG